MIRYVQGNLLEAGTEAIVNTVNEVGVMGKGIALMVKEAYPEASREYQDAARAGDVKVGRMFLTRNRELTGPRWVIHFPTKRHWRHPSKLEWIREGLRDLIRVVRREDIRSVAIPPLGSGSGGLQWSHVRAEIQAAMSDLPDVEVVVFEPSDVYYNAPKREGVEELTPARALIAELVRRYSILGLDCSILEVQKLAWFLERALERTANHNPLDLRFKADRYGPYADRLRHLLNALDGSFLHSEHRMSEAKPSEPVWFDQAKRAEVAGYLDTDDAKPYRRALEVTAGLIEGFESPLGMELLASVDWLIVKKNIKPTVNDVRQGLRNWPGGKTAGNRKARLFSDRMLELAIARLGESPLAGGHSSPP